MCRKSDRQGIFHGPVVQPQAIAPKGRDKGAWGTAPGPVVQPQAIAPKGRHEGALGVAPGWCQPWRFGAPKGRHEGAWGNAPGTHAWGVAPGSFTAAPSGLDSSHNRSLVPALARSLDVVPLGRGGVRRLTCGRTSFASLRSRPGSHRGRRTRSTVACGRASGAGAVQVGFRFRECARTQRNSSVSAIGPVPRC